MPEPHWIRRKGFGEEFWGRPKRFPGALTLEAVTAMRQALLTTSGEELDDTGVKPVALLYYRSVLCRRATGAQSREMLNLAAALDHLLRGRVVCAADIISQRLKAQEAVTQGTSWSVALRMEVPPPESGSLVSRAELQQARREDYSEAQARWRTQANSGSKGDGKGKGKNQKGHQEPWKKDEKKEDAGRGKDRRESEDHSQVRGSVRECVVACGFFSQGECGRQT